MQLGVDSIKVTQAKPILSISLDMKQWTLRSNKLGKASFTVLKFITHTHTKIYSITIGGTII